VPEHPSRGSSIESSHDPPAGPLATLVLPTYNAAAFVVDTVERLRGFLARHPEWRVMFVCDGCNDGTEALLGRVGPGFDVRAYSRNRGKGFAIRTGFDAAATPYLVFTDVDLSYEPEDACRIVALLQTGADLVVANRVDQASRYSMGPRDFATIYRRHLMSRAYNAWVRAMLPIRERDAQAGLKGISRVAWTGLAANFTIDGFGFDVELLARARQQGLRIVEMPVTFRHVNGTTVAMLRDGPRMLAEVIRIRRTLRRRAAAQALASVATESEGG
jgi:dolichyl-phosphate beta-glucosyltransferase